MANIPKLNLLRPHGTVTPPFNGAVYEQNGYHYDGNGQHVPFPSDELRGKPPVPAPSLRQPSAASTDGVPVGANGLTDAQRQQVYDELAARGFSISDNGTPLNVAIASAALYHPDADLENAPGIVGDIAQAATGKVPADDDAEVVDDDDATDDDPYADADADLALKAWLTGNIPDDQPPPSPSVWRGWAKAKWGKAGMSKAEIIEKAVAEGYVKEADVKVK